MKIIILININNKISKLLSFTKQKRYINNRKMYDISEKMKSSNNIHSYYLTDKTKFYILNLVMKCIINVKKGSASIIYGANRKERCK